MTRLIAAWRDDLAARFEKSCKSWCLELTLATLTPIRCGSTSTCLEADGCDVSLEEAEAALGVVPRGFLRAASLARPDILYGRAGVAFCPPPGLEFNGVAKQKEPINPFYVLLVIVGITFTITACAYGLMAFRAIQIPPDAADDGGRALMRFMDRYGAQLMAGQLLVLAIGTVAAMRVDRHRFDRAATRENSHPTGR